MPPMEMGKPPMGMQKGKHMAEAMDEAMGEDDTDDMFSFSPPEGFTPPDDMEEGKPFDVVTSMVMKDGKLAIKSINGAKVSQTKEEPESMEEEAPSGPPETEDGGATLASEIKKAGYGR